MTLILMESKTPNGRMIAGSRTITDGGIGVQLLTQDELYKGLVSEIGNRLDQYEATLAPDAWLSPEFEWFGAWIYR